MKSVALTIILLSCTAGFAQEAIDLLPEPEQSAFEIENQNVDIRDMEAEQKFSKEEAKRQEREAVETRKKLDEIKVKAKMVESKSQQDIAVYETRRKQAATETQKYNTELSALTKHINQLEQEVAQKQAEMKNAEDIAATGREELSKARQRHADLIANRRKVSRDTQKAIAKVKALKDEYKKVVQENRGLEQQRQPNGRFLTRRPQIPRQLPPKQSNPSAANFRQTDKRIIKRTTAKVTAQQRSASF